jgi:hypothetical protein
MTKEERTVPDSVVGEIIDWSHTQPLWVQDALRRIIENGTWTKADCDELCTCLLDEQRFSQTPFPLHFSRLIPEYTRF